MEELKQAIIREGVGIGNDIVKVDSFLNHRIDVGLSCEMGKEFHRLFEKDNIDMIFTVESSGIAIAVTTAQAFGNIPVVFAKKDGHSNVGSDVYAAHVFSFTHQKLTTVCVDKKCLPKGLRVLIIDDFIANGEAVLGMINILNQAECITAGIGICVEKGFQPGAKILRDMGYHVESLAIVDKIEDGKIYMRD